MAIEDEVPKPKIEDMIARKTAAYEIHKQISLNIKTELIGIFGVLIILVLALIDNNLMYVGAAIVCIFLCYFMVKDTQNKTRIAKEYDLRKDYKPAL